MALKNDFDYLYVSSVLWNELFESLTENKQVKAVMVDNLDKALDYHCFCQPGPCVARAKEEI